MRVLVTGASGFIGSNVCRALVNAGITVRGGTRTSGLGKQLEKMKLVHEYHVGDLRDPKLIVGIARGCDAVLHFADDRHVHARTALEVAVNGTENLMHEVRQEPAVSSIVFASSMAVYGPLLHAPGLFDPTHEGAELHPYGDPYADAKLGAEASLAEFARQGSPPITILRLPAVYGPGSKAWTRTYVTNARRNRLRTFGTGDYILRYLHIESAVAAVLSALHARRSGTYNVYDGVTTFNRFLQHYGDMFDPPRQVKHVPLWLVQFMFALSKLAPGAMLRRSSR